MAACVVRTAVNYHLSRCAPAAALLPFVARADATPIDAVMRLGVRWASGARALPYDVCTEHLISSAQKKKQKTKKKTKTKKMKNKNAARVSTSQDIMGGDRRQACYLKVTHLVVLHLLVRGSDEALLPTRIR